MGKLRRQLAMDVILNLNNGFDWESLDDLNAEQAQEPIKVAVGGQALKGREGGFPGVLARTPCLDTPQ